MVKRFNPLITLVITSYMVLVSHALWAKELVVAFGLSRPPYVDERSETGISVELFKQAAGQLDWQYKTLFVSIKRMERLLERGDIDVAVEMSRALPGLHYSVPFISYSNYAIHSRDPRFVLNSMQELARHSICAWQNASEHLKLSEIVAGKEDYLEFSKQRNQVIEWLNGKCDVILIDDTLLRWHLSELNQSSSVYINNRWGKVLLPFENNPLWFYVAFNDAQLRDAFNTSLKELIQTGRYQQIREYWHNAATK
ncbi:transporter substrate-binding domain-containing protein [Pseudoalteromonas sp. OOF1S-7]|uniref:substrate-binding periplasmic protein n=1 Tax=Pseudoalteromonas sp. OOF1S-7 TaxID=2917757 RepID=UPI001EF74860|nr:transporter substrate-binding domain-containing protein [Pseudoalteromonas sp. OOF1S-7]MCG7534105.1 transporter substrate-binding domain-containing protein [Pseudoalteromonas sp. OOF1S-7]